MSDSKLVHVAIEKMVIPTYVPPEPEEVPMYSEYRQHQGSTGYAYPNRVTISVERQELTDKEYEVIRLENPYIRLLILPELGGRILEGYDKKTDYNFLYRHHRIKPVIVGSYGSWISGGMEFNYPFHHRPSTFMPVDYTVEEEADGSVTVWLSEASPSPGQYRLKGTFGIKLRPDTSYLETKVKLDNRTPMEHPFMWWENAGVHVNSEYQLFFPQDVRYVHHHNDRHHATFPITKGWYAVENHPEPADISYHKNTIKGNSYFAGPSKYDFFGGYDHTKDCGIIHVGDHHITPGKKMFQWALEELGDAWNSNLTDFDGEHAELMAGSYSDDQPDFTWIAPYEVKSFSQYWYPIHGIKTPVYASLDAAVALDRNKNKVRVITTSAVEEAKLTIKKADKIVFEETLSLAPSEFREFDLELEDSRYSICFVSKAGKVMIDYAEDIPDIIRIPADNTGIPTPHQLKTPQEIYIAGRHIDQYRDPSWKGIEYFKVALERDPDYIPALLGMAEDCYNNAFYEEGLKYLKRVENVQNVYNQNPSDGTYSYFKGLCEYGLHQYDKAYDSFFKASWSYNAIASAMTFISAIDCRRGNYDKMKEHAVLALKKEADHAIAGSYAAIADWKAGREEEALKRIDGILAADKLDHLARYVRILIAKTALGDFYLLLNSNPSQTCMDIAFNLMDAGLYEESIHLLQGLKDLGKASAMALYTLAYNYEKTGDLEKAAQNRRLAASERIVDIFPYRLEEIDVLKAAIDADSADGTAIYLLGCLMYDKRHYEEASDLWEKATKSIPDFYIPYRNLAIAYYSKLNKRREALPLLLKACELKPGDDVLLKETNYVMAKLGIDGKERLKFILANKNDKISDNLTWDLANAYSNVGEYENALKVLENHQFVAAECQETYLTEAYTFANCALGRLARKDDDLEKALLLFKKAQVIPDNFRAGWWDKQALYYARYFEAETLMELGRKEEAMEVIGKILPFIHSGYSPYMGPETDYYVAAALRLAGDEITAVNYMSQIVMKWEKEIEHDIDRKMIQTSLYWSYVDDEAKVYKASIVGALAYSRLFFNDREGAKELFKKSLALDPDNIKAVFELKMLNA